MSWLSSFSPVDVRKRPPTPEFPVLPSDFDEQEIEAKKNTMTMPRSPSKNHTRGFFRGRSATPDRGRAPSPVTIPTVPNQNSQNMQTIPPSPRTVRMVKVLPDSPRVTRNTGRPPTPDDSVVSDLSWLQHFVIWNEREQPIFTTKAHVFQIDPDTKKNWIPASKNAVSVSYYYDSTRNTYRIISVDGSKAIINSTITPGMAFTKTSQKFGQWSDPRANTVYGLGFTSEADLAKFIEKFKEIKDLTRQQVAQQQVQQTQQPQQQHSPQLNGNVVDENHSASQTPPPPSPGARQVLHHRSSSLSAVQSDSPEANAEPSDQSSSVEEKGSQDGSTINLKERRNSFNTPGSGSGNSPESQMKYENDRLKLALAQSSANAKKWEVELQTLKNNNARLTAALQESTANVEEWKKQLAAYKDESGRMKKKVLEMEKQQNNTEQIGALQTELQQLTERLEKVQLESQDKSDEINQLNHKLEDLSAKETRNNNMQSRLQSLEEENKSLTLKVQDLQRQLQESKLNRDKDSSEILSLQDQLGNKVTELYELHEQIVSVIRKESNS